MSWVRCAFDEALFEDHALPCARALLRADLAQLAATLGPFAAQLSARDPAQVRGMMRLFGVPQSTPSGLAELAEDLGSDRLLVVMAAHLNKPEVQRALLLLSGLSTFEDVDDMPATAKEAIRSGRLPGLSVEESALYGLVPLVEACHTGEPELCSPPPEQARPLGERLALPGDDWREVEPFCGRTADGWIWYNEG